jgi:capsular exopolysaccharide synthesis family protein
MEPVDYLSGLRRRWWVVVAAVLIGILVGWVTRSVPLGTPGPKRYEASAAVLGSSNPDVTNLATLSTLTTVGPVPRLAAQKVHYSGDPRDLADQVDAPGDQGSGILWITATASTPAEAKRLANVFANELVKYTVVDENQRALAETRWLQSQMQRLSNQIDVLDKQIGIDSAADSLLVARRNAMIQAYGALVTRYQQVTAGSFEPSSLSVIQRAALGTRVTSPSGFLGALSLTWRLVVAGILGLVLGLILALVLERVDRRIRTREGAERSFGLPVLAEISDGRGTPIVGRSGKVTPAEPLPLLGALLEEGTARLAGDLGNGNGHRRPQTILVTSPTSGEGKSSVVARLATTYASEGKRVLVVSSDFRGGGIDRQFGVSNEHGLSDALLAQEEEPALERYIVSTKVPNVWLLPSGRPPMNRGSALASDRMRRILDDARSEVDVVLVDAAPILMNGDAPHLLRDMDSVLVVVRTGKTTTDEAKRAADILARLDAPVAGVALSGARG